MGGWAAPQLGEFLAVLAAALDEQGAVNEALSGLAASFAADACVFLRDGSVTASVGWPGRVADSELIVAMNNEQPGIDLPGLGWCDTVAITVDRDAHTTVMLVRSGTRFTADEIGLLRGMARVLALGLRLLGSVAVERRQAVENQGLAISLRDGQMLLERLADIQRKIATRESLPHILDAITAGVAELLDDETVGLRLLDETDPAFMVIVSSVGLTLEREADLWRVPVRVGVGGRAIIQDRVCIASNYQDWDCAIAEFSHNSLYSAMAAPIQFEGRPIGCLAVASRRRGRVYSERERSVLVAFAEHAGLALNDARTREAMNITLTGATHQATHDDLTGLPNRACFYDRTDQALRHADRDGTSTAVLLFDLDRFKEINDTLGHKYGDHVLREVGPRIRRGLRDADTLARLGGDEFGVLLPGVQDVQAAVEVAERVMDILEEPFDLDGMTLALEASCGIAVAPADGDTAELLLQRSDVAMYLAKNAHTHIVSYDAELNVNSTARLSLLGGLRTAIAQNELVLHYQPKARLVSGQIQGVEALIRWQHPSQGMIPPGEFIPPAEQSGLIKPLTTWVLNAALSQLRDWRERTDQPSLAQLTMAINVSVRNLLDDTFPSEVAAALDRWHVPAKQLELEITESAFMSDPARAHRLLSELSASGVKLSIDDYGTGYSSLAYLKNLPVDVLKIDQSFVLHMNEDPHDANIVRSVIDLSHNLGLTTVAEGIEDLDTWQQLTNLGCDSAQGYYLARPMPARALETWLRERQPEG